MHSFKITGCLILVFCALSLVSCGNGSDSSPTVQVNENDVDTVSFEETIRINNCGNSTNSEQTKERSFSTSIEGAAELGVNYQIIEGSVLAKYGQHRSVTTSQKLIAAPNTNMEFILRWSEEVRAGNVTVNGKTSTYSVRIPVSVEQISSRDLGGCDGGPAPITDPTRSAPQSTPVSTFIIYVYGYGSGDQQVVETLKECASCQVVYLSSINDLPNNWRQVVFHSATATANLPDTCRTKQELINMDYTHFLANNFTPCP